MQKQQHGIRFFPDDKAAKDMYVVCNYFIFMNFPFALWFSYFVRYSRYMHACMCAHLCMVCTYMYARMNVDRYPVCEFATMNCCWLTIEYWIQQCGWAAANEWLRCRVPAISIQQNVGRRLIEEDSSRPRQHPVTNEPHSLLG